MELNNIIDRLIENLKEIRKHNHGNKQSEIYKDLDKQSELVNKLIQLSKQPSSSDAEDKNMNIARQLTDIAEKIQAITKLMALVIVSNSPEAKAFFINDTLTSVIDSLDNSVIDILNVSDGLVDLDD